MKTNIMQVYITMHQNDFFSYGFLSEDDTLESDLRALCRQHLTADNFLHIEYGTATPRNIMDAIQTGDLKDFLIFFLTDMRGSRTILKELFLNKTHFAHPNQHHEHLSRSHFEKMAEKFFMTNLSSFSTASFASFLEEFQSATENYNTMANNLKTLMDSEIFEEEIIENRNDRYPYNNRLSMLQAFKRSVVNVPQESIGSTEQQQRAFITELRNRRSRYSPWGWNGMSEFRAVQFD
jgi:hypothetical protein